MTASPPARAVASGDSQRGRAGAREAWRGFVPEPERSRLRATVGMIIWRERLAAGMNQRALVEASGLSLRSVERLEAGQQRPTDSSTAKLARGLRRGRDQLAVVALDLELQRAAEDSLRLVRRRHRARWSRLTAQVAAEQPLEPMTDDLATTTALAALAGAFCEDGRPVVDPPRSHRVDAVHGRGGGRRAR